MTEDGQWASAGGIFPFSRGTNRLKRTAARCRWFLFFSGFRTAERSGEDGATKEKGNDTTAAAVRQTPVVDSFLPRLRPDVWVRLCFLSAGIFVS